MLKPTVGAYRSDEGNLTAYMGENPSTEKLNYRSDDGDINWNNVGGPQQYDVDEYRDPSKSDRGIEGSESYDYGSYANPRDEHGEYLDDKIDRGDINSNDLTPEQAEELYKVIMYGTQSKERLKEKLKILMSREDLIRNIIFNQAQLSIEQMKKEKAGYPYYGTDRNYQFMQTLIILKENGYNFDTISFTSSNNRETMDFIKFIAYYANQCRENGAQMKSSIVSNIVDKKISSYPELIASAFVKDACMQNPKRFEEEYQKYLAPKKDGDFRLSFEEYMRITYHVDVTNLSYGFIEPSLASNEVRIFEDLDQDEAPRMGR